MDQSLHACGRSSLCERCDPPVIDVVVRTFLVPRNRGARDHSRRSLTRLLERPAICQVPNHELDTRDDSCRETASQRTNRHPSADKPTRQPAANKPSRTSDQYGSIRHGSRLPRCVGTSIQCNRSGRQAAHAKQCTTFDGTKWRVGALCDLGIRQISVKGKGESFALRRG